MDSASSNGFARRGFYLHACWDFNYPFAVKRRAREDYRNTFKLLRRLGFDVVMLWPTTEAAPAPLSDADAADLRRFRETIDDAKSSGLETWLTFCANLTARPEIAARPLFERHLYPFKVAVRLDDSAQREPFFAHRRQIISILNNADAYVTIDGDPGGYPQANPSDFLRVFLSDRATLDTVGIDPQRQKLIPWIWCGWGSDWETHGVWREPLEPLVRPVLATLKERMPEPWELLPGRSFAENWANGRTNFALTEEAGLIDRSMLLTYEIVEFEPTPPAVVIQFDAIRRVLRQEAKYAHQARGLMANAQQPIMAIPSLYFFARGSIDLSYLDRTDEQVLRDLADFLGGKAELLIPAWRCLQLELGELSEELAMRLRASKLTSSAASLLPGRAEGYLTILADFVEARRRVLEVCDAKTDLPASATLAEATKALVRWWAIHRYVFDGTRGERFEWFYTHPGLLEPLMTWIKRSQSLDFQNVSHEAARRLADERVLNPDDADRLLSELNASSATH